MNLRFHIKSNAFLRETLDEVKNLLNELKRARQIAIFLDDVAIPPHLPTQITMVLLKHPLYRAILEGYLEFKQSPTVRLEEAMLEAPLKNLPYLYQVWGTLNVFTSLLNAAVDLGYQVTREQLTKRDAQGVYIQLLPNGDPILELSHPVRNTVVKLIPERVYGKDGTLQSSTHRQRPDIALEILTSTQHSHVYIFDPKYKLTIDKADKEIITTDPVIDDINKMHVYRDAIRDKEGKSVVDYAAILYPGTPKSYSLGIDAIQAYPGKESAKILEKQLYEICYQALML
jgi:predicted component of viral defense system (DUF524 family)